MAAWNVNESQAVILRLGGAAGTAHHQTDNGLLWTAPKMYTRFYQDGPLANRYEGAVLRKLEVQNRSGSTANAGVGFRLANRVWIGGRFSANGATYTDLTSSLQAVTTATLQVTGADQTGFVIGCVVPFDWVSINITTAETNDGGATIPDHKVYYSNIAGSDWVEIASDTGFTDNFTLGNTVYAEGVKNFVWQHSNAWGQWTSTILPQGYYYLRFTSADREANDVAAVCTGAEIGVGLFMEGLADGDIYADDSANYFCEYADGLVGYFSVADEKNTVKAFVT